MPSSIERRRIRSEMGDDPKKLRESERKIELGGRRVLVVGLARTGQATVRFLRKRGAIVKATEIRSREEMKEVASELESMGVETEWGGHRIETFVSQDMIVVSPGVDLGIEPIREAKRRGIDVMSEIELAFRFIDAPIVAVTGTNGKTTTTMLIGKMLEEDGRRVGVGGNVGKPLILFADDGGETEFLIVEVSSFQLEAIQRFRPYISVLLNITEDHLDRYRTYDDYIEAKSRIFSNQTHEDIAVLNRDDPLVAGMASKILPEKFYFSLAERLEHGAYFDGRNIVLRHKEKEEVYSLEKARLKGLHNIENMMASVGVARLLGCKMGAVQAVLDRFEGLEHRLEFVREVDGVRFYNDSKGTNVGSVVKALQSFSEPIVLIAGGKDKNGDLAPLKELVKEKVKKLVLIGEARERMARELGSFTETEMADSLDEAVLLARRTAARGDVVLLSPACSSFDMFTDYKERGRVFKEVVRRIGAQS